MSTATTRLSQVVARCASVRVVTISTLVLDLSTDKTLVRSRRHNAGRIMNSPNRHDSCIVPEEAMTPTMQSSPLVILIRQMLPSTRAWQQLWPEFILGTRCPVLRGRSTVRSRARHTDHRHVRLDSP